MSFTLSAVHPVTGDTYPNAFWTPIVCLVNFADNMARFEFLCYQDQAHRTARPGSYFDRKVYNLDNVNSQITFDSVFGPAALNIGIRVKAENVALAWLDTVAAGHTAGDGAALVSFFASATHNTTTF